jgi:membrane dipeptidase
MKAAVVVFPGINRERDMARTLRLISGREPAMVWHADTALPAGTDLVVVPGGFSYGDYLRCGAIAARAPVMDAVRAHAGQGGLVLGVCNGFQILCEAHLLPGALVRNQECKFLCRYVTLRVENAETPFTRAYRREQLLRIPIAHGEGRYVCDEATKLELEAGGRILFRYADAEGVLAPEANPNGSMDSIARWKRWFRENGDLILPLRAAADIERAKREGKTGIILGWQNLSGIEDRIGCLGLFKELGVGVMQIAYNTQNLVGSGCYESRDGGLSDFGRVAIHEMNRVGILCDLSHVGARTSEEVILHSTRPVAYTHVLPAGLKAHPRNKSDAELRFIAERGGFIGVTMFPPFLARGNAATIEDYVHAIDYVGNVAGWERIGIGTDFTQGQEPGFFEYLCRDKGRGRRVVEFGEIVNPKGLAWRSRPSAVRNWRR